MPIAIRAGTIAQRLFPVLGWLPAYRSAWLLPDVPSMPSKCGT